MNLLIIIINMGESGQQSNIIARLYKVSKWFQDFSSMSGISQYRTSDNKVSKYIWFVLYLAGLCGTIIMVKIALGRYLGHAFLTVVTRENQFSVDFPSVTICNPNRIHCQHLYDMIDNCTKVG